MGTTALLDFFKKKKPKDNLNNAPTMNGNLPFYTSFGTDIYASDIVMQSIRCKANEFKKLQPKHIINKDGLQTIKNDSSIARCLRRPNEYMTMADFLEKITILLELNKNVFIYPQYYITKSGERYYTGLYPLKPSQVDYLVDDSGEYFIKMQFLNGYETTFHINDIIHWRKDYGVNDYFGGGEYGTDRGLLKTLTEYDKLTQSIAKAVECSCQINALVKLNTYLDDGALEEKKKEFDERLKNNQSGILYTDLKTEYVPMQRDVKLVDKDTLQFFYDTILRANGCSLAILNGDYTKAQKEAYYEHALEADIKSLGQAISKTIFSDRETSYGNEIILYPNAIEFMSMENKLTALQVCLPAGTLTRNEARYLLGFPPLENGGDEIAQGYNNIININGGASSNEGQS